MSQDSSQVPGGITFVELIRLAVVILSTGVALEISTRVGWEGSQRLAVTALGAGGGYVLGGVSGRFVQNRMSTAERSLQRVPTSEVVAGTVGGLLGLAVGGALSWPVLLFGGKVFTVPLASIVLLSCGWAGLRVGRGRASDLLRYLGAGGRMPSGSRAAGAHYKLIDTSALIDGRLVDVCRDGWVDGVLLVPSFVLYELQGLADSSEPERRRKGQRGLDALTALQRLSTVGIEILEEDAPGSDVDMKLVHVAKHRETPLITTDANLARVAEVQGIKVRNLHVLADNLRPPVQPGDELSVRISKSGREQGQGVGFLPDGTMVVVENAEDDIGGEVKVEVTSLMSNAHGRMLFATKSSQRAASAATKK